MTLSGRVLAEQTFIEAVEPSIDEEVLDAEQTYASKYGSDVGVS